MPSLDVGSGSPSGILSGVSSFIANPNTELVTLLSTFLFGMIASLWYGTVEIINAVVTFITTPFIEGGKAIAAFFSGLLTSPLSILETTALASAEGIAAQFGWLAFPVGVAVVLSVLFMINRYREEPETGDTFPGLPFDTPDIGPFEIGTTEEGEDEADE